MKTNDIITNDMKKNRAGSFLLFSGIFAAAGLLLAAAIVAAADPFFRYHDPLPGFPYVIDNQLSQNIGMAERFSYDGVITGSSMTMNFDTQDFTELFADHPQVLKLTMNGALPGDIGRMLEAVYGGRSAAEGEIREIFIAIDPAAWTAEEGSVKYPYPEYLYDRNPFNDVKYLLNMEVLLEYCVKPAAEREGTPLNRVYMTEWEDDLYYTLDWILSHYDEPAAAPEQTPADAYLADTVRNMETYILPYVRAHPETEWYFFFPPYSLFYWHDAVRGDHLEATLAQEAAITELLLKEENVRVFQYQDREEIITDLDGGYMDEVHFRPEVNAYMAADMAADGERIRDAADMERHLTHLRTIIESREPELAERIRSYKTE